MKYLSLDLESTGLEADCYLIQLAFVPVDVKASAVLKEMGVEFLIKCPTFEELKPKLNSWVVKHNEGLIKKANLEGLEVPNFITKLEEYLRSEPIQTFFNKEKIMLMGKSMTALDIPLMTRYLGHDFMRDHFHHHSVDVTGVAHSFVDAGLLPAGHASGSKLAKYFNVAAELKHTALQDAIDMGEIYLRLVAMLKSPKPEEPKQT